MNNINPNNQIFIFDELLKNNSEEFCAYFDDKNCLELINFRSNLSLENSLKKYIFTLQKDSILHFAARKLAQTNEQPLKSELLFKVAYLICIVVPKYFDQASFSFLQSTNSLNHDFITTASLYNVNDAMHLNRIYQHELARIIPIPSETEITIRVDEYPLEERIKYVKYVIKKTIPEKIQSIPTVQTLVPIMPMQLAQTHQQFQSTLPDFQSPVSTSIQAPTHNHRKRYREEESSEQNLTQRNSKKVPIIYVDDEEVVDLTGKSPPPTPTVPSESVDQPQSLFIADEVEDLINGFLSELNEQEKFDCPILDLSNNQQIPNGEFNVDEYLNQILSEQD